MTAKLARPLEPAPVYDLAPPAEDFLSDVVRGLTARNKTLPCKYFYDEIGSRLFDRICELPEYYPTRTELSILHRNASEMGELLGPRCLVIEYGSGSSNKTRVLLDHLKDPAAYVPVEIAREHLEESARLLRHDYPQLEVHAVCADFTRPLRLPRISRPAARRVVYFPGSTIGNFTPEEARRLLERSASLCGAGGAMILGVDLKKEPRVLEDAYNDREGVTAAFNLNLLARINRELGTRFDTEAFWHHALYDPREGRIEMHLVSRKDQQVALDGHRVSFVEGESICTEYSYKYSIGDLHELARLAGFTIERSWIDDRKYFSVHYLVVPERRDDSRR
ncbi:MAG: L-histidine N(alpha)-methyltransferase [Candidatus Binataceae bacterium]|nr:L-histidine N(alpha)-methyltransferase [Candidatus Binataceae bacterium]